MVTRRQGRREGEYYDAGCRVTYLPVMPASQPSIRATPLPSGELVPVLGQGTWRMGEDAGRRKQDIAALRLGIELGMTLIDTAEMYADGGAETVVGEALTGRRDGVFVVTKVTPGNATRRGTVRACERSLRRLRTSHIDLYLLHWPADAPIAETVAAFDALMRDGKIRYWGVSNLDLSELEELTRLPTGGACASDQVLYNLRRRGIEWDLLPWCAARQMPVMAYSPIDQGELLHHPAASELASRYGVTASQIALAWTVRKPGIIAIPKAGSIDHVRDNHGALGLHLTSEDLMILDGAFPPPTGPRALETA
jgi:diketogulonate reductase-like aldo/keto reductase